MSQGDGSTLGRRRDWWRHPTFRWWALPVFALLLFLHKPHALLTPQLWAEDGSIFLMQAEADGGRAILTPYMGYLHLLPRLVAWFCSATVDPVWWPLLYNGTAFVLWIAVVARMLSPRLDLPGKPWLAGALFLGPQTGEILFNITNVQWITVFVLLQQALCARPMTPCSRYADLVWVVLAGLTGPFSLVLVPLFAWRWWSDRHRDNLALLVTVAICAAIQAWFLVRTDPKFPNQAETFHLASFSTITARRLLVWPVLGSRLALTLPPAWLATLGWGLILAVLVGAGRPHPLRRIRLPIVAAFGLLLVASTCRARPDTWAADDLSMGDRYFYLSRVLLFWLLIWEFNAPVRIVSWGSRALCLAAALAHVPQYIVPTPIDYQWSKHCDPIRQGVPANLPTLPEGWTLEYRGHPHPR